MSASQQATPTHEQIMAAIADLISPDQIDTLAACDGLVKVEIILASTSDPKRETLFPAIHDRIKAMPGVEDVSVLISLKTPMAKPTFNKPAVSAPAGQVSAADYGIKHIIAISSGKGGVGKTTVSVNLACALQQAGYRVGILDADIYGPNVPIMMGLRNAKLAQDEVSGKLVVPENHQVKVISMAFLIKEEQPVIWRGPMLDKVIRQFLTDTLWSASEAEPLDYLLIDLPPGTGDAQLTVMQAMPVTGAIIVTTPQEVAIHDSRKGLLMFQNNHIPVLGIVENMSYFVGDDGKRYDIFGHGGGQKAAQELGVPFLSEIPLVSAQREKADQGLPIVVDQPASPQALVFQALAQKVVTQINHLDAQADHSKKTLTTA